MTPQLTASVMAPPGTARLFHAPTTDPATHREAFGPLPGLAGHDILALVDAAGLTGRGGAGFPTARKMRAVRGRPGAVVVANASEGEPLSDKDAALLSHAPHLVLDGLVLAARTVGAQRAYLVTKRPDLADTVQRALLGRRERRKIEVALAPDGFISGEESAAVSWLNNGPGLPTDKRVPVFERGVRGRPTLVSNVETLAQVALIARFGGEWFRALGTDDEPGTMLATVSGAVAAPGVFEVPLGTPLSSLLDAARATSPEAVLVGGFHGAWVRGRDLRSVSLSRASLAEYGAAPGAGVVMALGRDECGLEKAADIVAYLAGQSARQCGPCVNGLPRMADTLTRLARGDAREGMVSELGRLQDLVRGRGACAHPDGTARLVASTLRVFADEVAHHHRGGCSVASAR